MQLQSLLCPVKPNFQTFFSQNFVMTHKIQITFVLIHWWCVVQDLSHRLSYRRMTVEINPLDLEADEFQESRKIHSVYELLHNDSHSVQSLKGDLTVQESL